MSGMKSDSISVFHNAYEFINAVARAVVEILKENKMLKLSELMTQREVEREYGVRRLQRAKEYGLKGKTQGGRTIYCSHEDVNRYLKDFPSLKAFPKTKSNSVVMPVTTGSRLKPRGKRSTM